MPFASSGRSSSGTPWPGEGGDRCARRGDAAAWIQGALAPPARRAFERHLEACAACRSEVAALEEVLAAMLPAPAADAAPGLAGRVLAALPDGAFGRRARHRPERVLAGLSAAAALLVLIARLPFGESAAPRPAEAGRARLEVALDGGIQWLLEAQEADGSWSSSRWGGEPGFDVGVTGLAVAALASAASAQEAPARRAIDAGIHFLLRAQDATGRIGGAGAPSLYNHAPATVALLEVGGRFRWPAVGRAAARALRHLEEEGPATAAAAVAAAARRDASAAAWLALAAEARALALADETLAGLGSAARARAPGPPGATTGEGGALATAAVEGSPRASHPGGRVFSTSVALLACSEAAGRRDARPAPW